MTIDQLKDYGANVDEGVARCMGDQGFYLKMVALALSDDKLPQLKAAIKDNNLEKAFDYAHAMKGVYGNLSLTPLYDAVSKITEKLRAKEQADYSPMLSAVSTELDKLHALSN